MSKRKTKVEVSKTAGVIVGDGKKKPHFGARTRLTGLIVGGALLISLIAVATLLVVHKLQAPNAAEQKQSAAQKVAASLPGKTLQQKVNNAMAAGKYDEAAKLLAGQKDTQSREVLDSAAGLYINTKQYQKALDTYALIDKKLQLNQGEVAAAAQVAEMANQYPLAVTYYKKAKLLAETNKQFTNTDDLKRYDQKIQALGTKQ